MSTTHTQPEIISEEDFLCGSEGPDPWLKQNFVDYIKDIDKRWDFDEIHTLKNGYFLSPSKDSMLLMIKSGQNVEIVGYYNTPGAVCIKDEHQGQGLGAELILATYEWCGGPPTEGLDEQSFTEEGYAAHQAAYRLGVARGMFESHEPERAPVTSTKKPSAKMTMNPVFDVNARMAWKSLQIAGPQ
jgi:GNAT superfamily N-acetyltransferase